MRFRILLALFAVLAVLPITLHSEPYWLSLLTTVYINAIMAVTIWPLFVIGRLTLAHGAFYGMGAYGTALLMLKLGWSFWLAMPTSVLLVAVVACLVGLPTLRIHGTYFIISTFALGEVVRLAYMRFGNLFGGAQGLYAIPGVSPIQIPFLPPLTFSSFLNQYYLVFAALSLTTICCYRLVHSHLGLILRSIHYGSRQSLALGVNVFRYELVTFVFTAAGAAFAGSLYAPWAHYLNPSLFGFSRSVDAQAYVIIGGAGFVLGPIIGAAYMTLLPEVLNLAKQGAPIITGLSIILAVAFLRGGLITLPHHLLVWGQRVGRMNRGLRNDWSPGEKRKNKAEPARVAKGGSHG